MKRCVFILLLVLLLLFQNNKDSIPVFRVTEEEFLDYIYLKIDGLNDSNFEDYFSNIKVVAVFPYINPIYKDKIEVVYEYKNIGDLKDFYISKLKSKGFHMEANSYLLRKIAIDKVLVYATISELREKLECKNIDIQFKNQSYVKLC